VIFSHSSARAIVDHPRNVPDSILRRLPKNGGVVMVTFVPSFVSPPLRAHQLERARVLADFQRRYRSDTLAVGREMRLWDNVHAPPRASLKDVADHIEHVRRVGGADHVGIGSDFDGVDDNLPVGLEDLSKYPDLFAELILRGWSDADLRKLAGENVLRALTTAERVAQRLQKERPASTKTIEELDGKGRTRT